MDKGVPLIVSDMVTDKQPCMMYQILTVAHMGIFVYIYIHVGEIYIYIYGDNLVQVWSCEWRILVFRIWSAGSRI